MALAEKLPRLDDRSFDDIRKEARQRIARYTPEWNDFNDGDAGMALIECFAWMTDLLLYRLNRTPRHARLKLMELMGLRLEAARPAAAFVSFEVEEGWPEATVVVPRGTQVAAGSDAEGPIVFETERPLVAFAPKLKAVLSAIAGASLDRSAANAARDEAWTVFTDSPEPGAALLLGFAYNGEFPVRTELCLTIWLAEGPGGPLLCGGAPVASGVKLAWEAYDGRDWRPLALLRDDTQGFFRSGQTFLKTLAPGVMKRAPLGPVTDALYWIRARVARSGWDTPPAAFAIRANTVSATHGQTVEGEVLGGSDGASDQTFTLAGAPVIAGSLTLRIDEGEGPKLWQEVDDFVEPDGAAALDPEVRAERRFYTLDRTTGAIRLDGAFAHAPAANPDQPSSSVRADRYRYGGGRRGNVAAAALASLLTPVDGIDAARTTNLFAADGGSDEETLERLEARGARALKARDRAVTAEDFEHIALSAGPVGRAKALPLRHPDFPDLPTPGVVTVVIVPSRYEPAPSPSPALLACVCAALDKARLLTTEVYVVPPRYVTVRVIAELYAEPDADPAALKDAAEAALALYFHPLKGGAGAGWPFGGDLYFSRVHQTLLLPGVARLGAVEMELDGELYPPCADAPLDPDALLASGEHAISVLTVLGEDGA